MNLDNSAKQQPSPASPNDISHPAVVKASVVSLASPAAPSESALNQPCYLGSRWFMAILMWKSLNIPELNGEFNGKIIHEFTISGGFPLPCCFPRGNRKQHKQGDFGYTHFPYTYAYTSWLWFTHSKLSRPRCSEKWAIAFSCIFH